MSKEKETIINEVKVNRPRFYHEAAIAIQFENDNNGPVILKVIAGYNVSEEQFVLVKANKKFRKNFAIYDDIEKQAIMFNHGYEYVDTVLQNPACRKPIEIVSITPLLKAGSDNKIRYILVSYKLIALSDRTDDSVEGNIDTKESEPKTYPEDINPWGINLTPVTSMQTNDKDTKDCITNGAWYARFVGNITIAKEVYEVYDAFVDDTIYEGLCRWYESDGMFAISTPNKTDLEETVKRLAVGDVIKIFTETKYNGISRYQYKGRYLVKSIDHDNNRIYFIDKSYQEPEENRV